MLHSHLVQQEGGCTVAAQVTRALVRAQARKWTRCVIGVAVFTHVKKTCVLDIWLQMGLPDLSTIALVCS